MTCQGCVNSVTNALKAVFGVKQVNVSLERNQAAVTFDDTLATVNDLQKAIEEAGFEYI